VSVVDVGASVPDMQDETKVRYATAAPPSNNDNDDAVVNHATVAGYSMPACDYFRVHEMYARSMENSSEWVG
jgi:hypothetical protein